MTQTLVLINGIEHLWYDTEEVTYAQLVAAAFPGLPFLPVLSITWRKDDKGGIIAPGETLSLEEGMIINVSDTSNA